MNNLYSRQIGAIGTDAMKKLMELKVLILGCDTEGMECAKSLALMGVKKMYLFDNTKITTRHKGRLIVTHDNTVLSQNCKKLVEELTTNCCEVITIGKKSLVNHLIKNGDYDVVVETRLTSSTFEYEKLVMDRKKPYIFGTSFNLYGYVFSNFGKNWEVLDADGENTISGYVENYTSENGKLKLFISDMKVLPSNKTSILKSKNSKLDIVVSKSYLESNKLLNTSQLVLETDLNQKTIEFLESNDNVLYYESKDINTVSSRYFNKTSSTIDIPNNGYQYLNLTSSYNIDETTDKLRQDVINLIANKTTRKQSGINLSNYEIDLKLFPLGVIVGNIIAHEVIKCTHKYTPLDTELVFDYSALKSNIHYSTKGAYSDVNALLDKTLVKKLKKLKVFMVGCGALGCELSKNMAMMGFSTKYGSSITLTDMDTIEVSNLTRQFLFRPEDINKHKSDVLKERLVGYKPNYDNSIIALKDEVGSNNEHIFNKNFWSSLDIVVNALDNVAARKYVDSMCNRYDKPLFESGTLGTKCNTQVIIPYETATYSEIKDQVDNSIPMCTIRSFPSKIEHCVEWGLENFSKIISSTIEDYNLYIENSVKAMDKIKSLNNDVLILEHYKNLHHLLNCLSGKETTIDFVNYLIVDYFVNPVKEILQTFPKDMLNSDGKLFWSGKKLKPSVLTFSNINKKIYEFLPMIFGLEENKSQLDKIELSFNIQKQANNKLKKLNVDEDSDKINTVVDEQEINQYRDLLINYDITSSLSKINQVKYDKDDDMHNQVMTHIVNLRAETYGIDKADNLKVKLISGRVVPALSTTTSVIAGFVIIDILKHLSSNSKKWLIKPTECNINLANNQYTIYDSMKPSTKFNKMYSEEYGMQINTIPRDFTTWSKLKISGADDYVTTVNELVTYLQQQYNIPQPDVMTIGNRVIYNKYKNNGDMDFKKLYSEFDKNITETIDIDIDTISKEGLPIVTPPIIYSYLSF